MPKISATLLTIKLQQIIALISIFIINFNTLYHLIFVVKIKNNMRVCIIGSGLTALTLAKAS